MEPEDLHRAEAPTVALYTSAGLLIAAGNPPILLITIILVQGSVYACSLIAALWNMRAQRVPDEEYRRRFAEQQLRQGRRRDSPAELRQSSSRRSDNSLV